MRRFPQDGYSGLSLLMVLACACIGCRPAVGPETPEGPPSVTTTMPVPPSVTTSPVPPPSMTAPPSAPETPAETPQAGAPGQAAAPAPAPTPTEKPAAGKVASLEMVPIEIDLPMPAFRGTPVPVKEPNVEKPRGGPRPPFLAPEGTVNLARGKPVSTSDPAPVAGELDYVTDGEKEASDFAYLELRPGSQWVEIDLGQKSAIFAVVVWHYHAEARVYRDVIVQVSDDPDFLDAQTVFNADYDNTSGLGIGSDLGYVETSEGKLIDCRGVEGRYVRLYSNGSNVDGKNHYTEVEVFGRPAE